MKTNQQKILSVLVGKTWTLFSFQSLPSDRPTAAPGTAPSTGQSEPKALENDEWAEFLDSTLEDAMENPRALLHANLVAMVVAPLRNLHASPSLVERIGRLGQISPSRFGFGQVKFG